MDVCSIELNTIQSTHSAHTHTTLSIRVLQRLEHIPFDGIHHWSDLIKWIVRFTCKSCVPEFHYQLSCFFSFQLKCGKCDSNNHSSTHARICWLCLHLRLLCSQIVGDHLSLLPILHCIAQVRSLELVYRSFHLARLTHFFVRFFPNKSFENAISRNWLVLLWL